MRLTIAACALILTAGLAPAQSNCPGGKCPAPAYTTPFGGYQLTPRYTPTAPTYTGSTPIGQPPTADHEWGVIPGHGYGWRFRPAGATAPASRAVAAETPPALVLALPPVGAAAEDDRWRPGVVLIRAYLVQRIMREGRTREQAERIVQRIGDGKLLKWLVENRERIFELIERLLPFLLLILDDGPDVPPMPVPVPMLK